MIVDTGSDAGGGTGGDGGAGAGGASDGGASDAAGGGAGSAGSAGGAAPGAGDSAAPAEGGGVADTAAPKPYTPNFKYKVLKEEKELPDWVRPLVKDEATEKQARDLFERADGIEAVKQHREALVAENATMRQQWQPFVQNAQAALSLARKGDLHGFFGAVGVPELDVLKYALQRLQLRENPQALAADEQQRALQAQAAQAQQQAAGYQQQLAHIAVQSRTMELDAQLTRQENLSVVQAFDTRVGKPGAFRAEVIRRGQLYAAQGIDVTAEQAVGEVLQLIGWQGQNPPPAGAGGGGAPEPKPTLPNIRGKGGQAPVKRVVRTTDDMRKLAREMDPRFSAAR